jgi:regulator of sigma E protease
MGTLVFILVLSILIIVHEFGHFMTAKKLGVRVERFAIGFGPILFKRIFKGTEFAVCLIPLGGYVKMAGDERQDCQGANDEFYAKSVGRRSLIVLAGPLVNYIFAFVCFFLVFMIGYPSLSTKIGEVKEDYPAYKAGIQTGDEILEVNDRSVEGWEDVQSLIAQSAAESSIALTVRRQQKEVSLTIVPVEEEAKNIFGQTIRSRFIGIVPNEEIVFFRYGPISALWRSGEKLFRFTSMTYKALFLMITGGVSARDAVTGPVGIFYLIHQAASLGFSYVLYIMAMISASLAIFNLLPFPILDGGHILFFVIEKIRGKPLSEKVDEAIHRVSLSLIVALAIFVFYNDFVRYGILDKIFHFISKIFS